MTMSARHLGTYVGNADTEVRALRHLCPFVLFRQPLYLTGFYLFASRSLGSCILLFSMQIEKEEKKKKTK